MPLKEEEKIREFALLFTSHRRRDRQFLQVTFFVLMSAANLPIPRLRRMTNKKSLFLVYTSNRYLDV